MSGKTTKEALAVIGAALALPVGWREVKFPADVLIRNPAPGTTILTLGDVPARGTMAEEQAAFWPQHPVLEASRYGTGTDDESEEEPESVSLTNEMARAGAAQMWEEQKQGIVGLPSAERIYRAMAAAAPVKTADDWEDHYDGLRDDYVTALTAARDAALARAEAAEKERDVLRDAVWHMVTTTDDTQTEKSNVDYIGPTKNGKAIPDPVHERVHHVVGDLLAGRVLPDACRQLQEALKSRPKEKPRFPVNPPGYSMGLRLP
jgi:hypothetical protein